MNTVEDGKIRLIFCAFTGEYDCRIFCETSLIIPSLSSLLQLSTQTLKSVNLGY
jgi:hypothetical protein